MKTPAEQIRECSDSDLIVWLKNMRRAGKQDRPHYTYSLSTHLALKEETKRRQLEV